MNLDQFQTRQAETKKKSANEAVDLRISEAYQWLLVPGQPDPKGEIDWTDLKLQGQDSLASRASKKLKNEESLLVQMGAVRLKTELDRIPLWNGNHVSIKQLSEYMARYLYLPRIRDESVLIGAIEAGVSGLMWEEEGFAYAEGWDSVRERYQGLRGGISVRIVVDDRSLLVKPSVAVKQLTEDRLQAAQRKNTENGHNHHTQNLPINPKDNLSNDAQSLTRQSVPVNNLPGKPILTRFHASAEVDPIRLGRDAARIAEEVVQHLSALVGVQIEITLEIQAKLPEGAPDKLVRDITENCRTLRFKEFGFEED